jgi:hypothetical protein
MSEHTHERFVSGCFRCELSREEAFDTLVEERDELESILDTLAEIVYGWVEGGIRTLTALNTIEDVLTQNEFLPLDNSERG